MADIAKEAGADYVKTQMIHIDELTFRPQFEEGLNVNSQILSIKRPYMDEYERLKKLELSLSLQSKFVEHCKNINIIPMTTVFSTCSLKDAKDCGFENLKIASYDCASFPFIEYALKFFKKIIISTGASYDNEIEETAKILKQNLTDINFLHCVTLYPTPPEQANLSRMKYLKSFSDSVGYSDHSHQINTGLETTLSAIFLGAELIERHFTILSPNETKDGAVSIGPNEIKEIKLFSSYSKEDQKEFLNKKFPKWERTIGSQKRNLSDAELLNRDYYRGRFASPRNIKNNKNQSQSNWIYNSEKFL